MYHGSSLELLAYPRHEALLEEAAHRRLVREATGGRAPAGAAGTLRHVTSWATARTNALLGRWGTRHRRVRWGPSPQSAPSDCVAPVPLPARIPSQLAA